MDIEKGGWGYRVKRKIGGMKLSVLFDEERMFFCVMCAMDG